mgnify:CR=1 FL=1
MKSTVFIIKLGPWKYAYQNRNHPEYAASFDLIEDCNAKLRFVLIYCSNAQASRLQLNRGMAAGYSKKKGEIT